MKHILGISAGFHDASLSILNDNGDILYAGHSERYSKIKNDPAVCDEMIQSLPVADFAHIAYYEIPWKKQLRRSRSGEGIDFSSLTTEQVIMKHIGMSNCWQAANFSSHGHHLSHAAAGFQTSPFNEATVVVIDAIGESDTISIWSAKYSNNGKAIYRKLWGQKYPHSIGLFYSAMTQRVGLKPNEEEYIMMGMAAYGKSVHYTKMYDDLIENSREILFKNNLHTGIDRTYLENADIYDLAATTQMHTEHLIENVLLKAKVLGTSSNLVYSGGVALNCSANWITGKQFKHIWIMPNPGDAGSSLGAAALAYGKKINWQHPYLGYEIKGEYPSDRLIDVLLTEKIVGVASGKAEFGPRAFGNRSLLADPRGVDIKDKVNAIKQRQKFRPFAPVILEEYVNEYFEMPIGWEVSPYMQVTALCKRPDLYPAIVHEDRTSRVQTVGKNCGSGIRELLEKWFIMTGCPMLLNTSLNIKGEPMVNDLKDAARFEKLYGIKVIS